jgi:predicted anti-sigma-YlaC factor YlaD
MNASECEQVRLAVMARADGESTGIPLDQIDSHLIQCATCRREIQAMRSVSSLFAAQSRRRQAVPLWPGISAKVAAAARARTEPDSAGFFVALGLVLAVCQAGLFVVSPAASYWIKAACVLVVAGLLGLRRINPFVIEPELVFSKKGSA